jgi:hypothetical protein
MLHVDVPSVADFRTLAAVKGERCVSLYLPTSPLAADIRANRIAFKDLAREALSQLRAAGFDKRDIGSIAARLDRLAGKHHDTRDEDKVRKRQLGKSDWVDEFWERQANGLGVLLTPRSMRTFRLAYRPKAVADVADRFYLAPLIRAMTYPHEILVLALSEERVRLLRAFINLPPLEVPVAKLPRDAREAVGRPSVHPTAPRGRLQNLEGEKVLIEMFARKVDEAIGNALAGFEIPMILAAAEPLASIFRAVSRYRGLIDEGIHGNPDHVTDRQLSDAALPILDRLYARELETVARLFADLKPRLATADLSFASHAATAGAIERMVVDFEVFVPGMVSEIDGSVTYASGNVADTYSVLDEVARRALATGASVLAARKEQMPDRAPLIAILRYPFPF